VSTWVWEVRATGGDPTAVSAAIGTAVGGLRVAIQTGYRYERAKAALGLDADCAEAWTEDVLATRVLPPAYDATTRSTSVLVEVEVSNAGGEQTAALLGQGFDDVVLDAVLALPGVTEVSHSDRIERPS